MNRIEKLLDRRHYAKYKPETIFISHGAGGRDGVDWFIVEPRVGKTTQSIANTPITNQMAVESLADAGARGRTVYKITAKPFHGGKVRTLKTVFFRRVRSRR